MFIIDPEMFWYKSSINIYCGTALFWLVQINSTNQKIDSHLPSNMEGIHQTIFLVNEK